MRYHRRYFEFSYETLAPQAFATPPWLWDSQVWWFDFSNLKSKGRSGGGGRPILRKSSKMPKSPKIVKFLYLAQSDPDWNHAGWGSKQPQRTPGERFWAHWWHFPIWEKSDFRTHKRKFSKIALGPDMGPGQIHGGVVWISMLGASEPPTLALFGDIIIFSQFHTEKNLEKFLSPDVGFWSRKKSGCFKS